MLVASQTALGTVKVIGLNTELHVATPVAGVQAMGLPAT